MKNPIENLGDYNKVREALQTAGGSIESLYKNVGDTAVSKATPKILLKGGVIGVGVGIAVYKGFCFMKERKQKIESEPILKKKFAQTLDAEIAKSDEEEIDDCERMEK